MIKFLNSAACRYCMTGLALVSLSFVTGLAAGGAFAESCSAIDDSPFGCAEYLLYRYQTLITGFFALVGAALLWVQISDQRAEADEQRRQRQIAARIRLPHALSKLMAYWEYCFEVWLSGDLSTKNKEPPYDALEAVMAAAPDANPATFETLQELLVLSQAFEARIRPHAYIRPHQQLNMMVVDIARLTHLSNSLFGYGRLEVGEAPYLKPDRQTLTEELIRYMPRSREHRVSHKISRAMDTQFGRQKRETADEEIDEII